MSEPEELPEEETGYLSEAAQKRILRAIERIAEALCAARAARPKEDHYTCDRLAKHGAPDYRMIRRVVRDHRLALYRAMEALAKDQKLPRWKRAPFFEANAVWP